MFNVYFIFRILPDNPNIKWDKKFIAESVRNLVDKEDISVVRIKKG